MGAGLPPHAAASVAQETEAKDEGTFLHAFAACGYFDQATGHAVTLCGCCAWAADAQQRACVACLPLHRRKYRQLNDYTLCQHREMSRGLMSCQGTLKCASPTLVRHRIGWLVPAHAVPVIGDLPHAAGAGGGAAGGAQGRPDRVPHLRLCAALHQLLHPHPGPGGAQQPSLRNQSCFFRMS